MKKDTTTPKKATTTTTVTETATPIKATGILTETATPVKQEVLSVETISWATIQEVKKTLTLETYNKLILQDVRFSDIFKKPASNLRLVAGALVGSNPTISKEEYVIEMHKKGQTIQSAKSEYNFVKSIVQGALSVQNKE